MGWRGSDAEGEGGVGDEGGGGELAGLEAGPGSGGDHGGVVSGEREGGEGDAEAAALSLRSEAGTKLAVGGDSAGDEDAGGAEGFGGGEGLLDEVADNGVLEAGDEVEGLGIALGERVFYGWLRGSIGTDEEGLAAGLSLRAEVVKLDVAQDGGLDTGEREEEVRIKAGDGRGFGGLGARRGSLTGQVSFWFELCKCEWDGVGIAVECESVDPGTTGVAEAEKLGDFVVGFAGGVVNGAADEGVVPGAVGGTGEIKMGVAAGDDEGQGGVGV